MASTGTREFRDSIDMDEKLVRNSDNVDIANETLYMKRDYRLKYYNMYSIQILPHCTTLCVPFTE